MTNDIKGFTDDTPYLPYMIWWPLKPFEPSLRTLAQQCPKMTHQIAIVCIFADYEDLYRKLQPKPHSHLSLAAEQSPNPFYKEDLEKRTEEQGIDLERTWHWSCASSNWLQPDLEPTSNIIPYYTLTPFVMGDDGQRFGTYFEYNLHSDRVETYVWLQPDQIREWEIG